MRRSPLSLSKTNPQVRTGDVRALKDSGCIASVSEEHGLRGLGHSKDHHRDLHQSVIRLTVR